MCFLINNHLPFMIWDTGTRIAHVMVSKTTIICRPDPEKAKILKICPNSSNVAKKITRHSKKFNMIEIISRYQVHCLDMIFCKNCRLFVFCRPDSGVFSAFFDFQHFFIQKLHFITSYTPIMWSWTHNCLECYFRSNQCSL